MDNLKPIEGGRSLHYLREYKNRPKYRTNFFFFLPYEMLTYKKIKFSIPDDIPFLTFYMY